MDTPSRPSRLVLLGTDVGSSLSPIFQRAALDAARIPLSYEAISVTPEELPSRIEEIRRASIAGNVTRPHKAAFHDACDELTPIARRVAAVNTFWVTDGRLYGDNTDVDGFDVAAREVLDGDTEEIQVLVLGAGGAASAVLAAVERWQSARSTVVARNAAKASRLAERYSRSAIVNDDPVAAAKRAALIVNATPIGQRDDAMPLDPSLVRRGTAVLDLVYRRGETAWVRALRANGNTARDGMTMLLEQGALSFRRWFGIDPDRNAMRRALE